MVNNMTKLEQLVEEKCEARVQMMQWKLARGMWRANPITEERAKLYDTINQHIEHLIERLDCEIKDEIEAKIRNIKGGK
jgi:pseudouridine-5'-phosphate glycosidase